MLSSVPKSYDPDTLVTTFCMLRGFCAQLNMVPFTHSASGTIIKLLFWNGNERILYSTHTVDIQRQFSKMSFCMIVLEINPFQSVWLRTRYELPLIYFVTRNVCINSMSMKF